MKKTILVVTMLFVISLGTLAFSVNADNLPMQNCHVIEGYEGRNFTKCIPTYISPDLYTNAAGDVMFRCALPGAPMAKGCTQIAWEW